jgi:hypothetical protein
MKAFFIFCLHLWLALLRGVRVEDDGIMQKKKKKINQNIVSLCVFIYHYVRHSRYIQINGLKGAPIILCVCLSTSIHVCKCAAYYGQAVSKPAAS